MDAGWGIFYNVSFLTNFAFTKGYCMRSFRVESIARTMMHMRLWLAPATCLFGLLAGSEPALAFSFDQAIERCRQSVGRPIVRACMSAKRGEVTGVDFDACRAIASPRVRACVRRAMIARFGQPHVDETIEHCRQTVGRPIVQACMLGRPRAGAALEACRATARPKVRDCVRRTINVRRASAPVGTS